MTTPAPHSAETPSPDAATCAAGWARPLLEEDLAVLARLRDAALAMAEAVAAQAQGQAEPVPSDAAGGVEAPPVFTGDLNLAFHRAARAVRMTCALRARLIDDIDRLEQQQLGRVEDLRAERKARLARLLTRIIEDDVLAPDDDDADDAATADGEAHETEHVEGRESESEAEGREWLVFDATERLDDRDRYGDLLDRPVSAFIDDICRDLGLSPDWRRLAEEAWAQEEIASGKVGAPLAAVAVSLPLDGGLRSRGAKQPAIKGGGGAASTKRPPPRTARTEQSDGPGTTPSPADPPPAEPFPPPIPALSPIEGERGPEPDPPPDPPAGLPGESPPPRRPRPPNVLSPDWGWTPTRP